MKFVLSMLRQYLVIQGNLTGHLEKWLSVAGGAIALCAVIYVSQRQLGLDGSGVLVASMGASAVLLFAVPHGPLSQPWSVFGGHLLSALIGVSCAKMVPAMLLAAPVAVGLSIGAMQYLRCIHPPGGATALSAVVGGEGVQQLGFQFVLTPVMVNVAIILTVALLFNAPFAWRRYPLSLMRSLQRERAEHSNPQSQREAQNESR